MIDFELTDEQRLIRETAREFSDREIAPRARENDRNEHFDTELVQKMADMGFLGAIVPEEYGGRGVDYLHLRPDRRGDRPRRLRDAHRGLGGDLARLLLDRPLGHRGAEAGVAARALLGRGARLLRADRAGHRLGRREPEDARREDRRRLAHQRRQDVDLARQLREARADLRPDRPGEEAQGPRLLPRADRRRRLLLAGDPRQARPQGLRHRRAVARRRRGAATTR